MNLTPAQIVSELDKHIVGQQAAKKAVAIALRNRWRRQQVDEPLKSEITPKNILMIGPTGVGKTEIARRLAKLANAPFLKIEATKFTEVGYVGRDVESMIRDLAEYALKMVRQEAMVRYATAPRSPPRTAYSMPCCPPRATRGRTRTATARRPIATPARSSATRSAAARWTTARWRSSCARPRPAST